MFNNLNERGWGSGVRLKVSKLMRGPNSAKAVEVARANIERVQAKNWPTATHSLPMEFPREIDAEILAFMDACGDFK